MSAMRADGVSTLRLHNFSAGVELVKDASRNVSGRNAVACKRRCADALQLCIALRCSNRPLELGENHEEKPAP